MSAAKPKNLGYIINSIIGIVIMLGFGQLNPIGSMTTLGMQVLGIFIGLIYMWATVGILWPSLLGILLMGFTEGATVGGAIQSAMGNPVVWQLFFIMIMLVPIEKEGVSQFLAKYILNIKFAKGRPWAFTTLFLLATFLVSASTSGTATILLFWAILYGILKSIGYTPQDKYSYLMVFGVVYASILGFSAFPFKGSVLAILQAYTKISGNVIDNAQYMLIIIPLTIIMILVYILIMKFVFRPDISKLRDIDVDTYFTNQNIIKMSRRQKFLTVILILSILLMFLPSVMPKAWIITIYLNKLGATGVMALIITIMVAVKCEGRPLLNFVEAAGKAQWGIVFLVMSALYIAGILGQPELGASQLFYDLLNPALGGRSELVFIFFALIAGVIITNLGNNAAVGIILMPILHTFIEKSGFNANVSITLVTMIVFIALLTPIASPHAALLHGNNEWISRKNVYILGVAMSVLSILLAFAIGLPLARLVY